MPQNPVPEDMRISLPEDQVAGVWASGVRATAQWQQVILDFLVQDDRGPNALLVVQRIRLDASAMQDALAVLSTALDKLEQTYGPVRPPD